MIRKPITAGMSVELYAALKDVQRELDIRKSTKHLEKLGLQSDCQSITADVAARLGTAVPKVIVSDCRPNAHTNGSIIFIDAEAALAMPDYASLSSVMAHELSHIKNGDATKRIYSDRAFRAASTLVPIMYVASGNAVRLISNQKAALLPFEVGLAVMALGVRYTINTLHAMYSSITGKIVERRADMTAIKSVGAVPFIKMQCIIFDAVHVLDKL